ncbi:hypothetical protein E4U15_007511 [Claviceps sp. LM218 group G6]|nr:hypothetical protein E4U15_007511 [Claviceps sp. LM218 group G6]
MPGSQSTPSAAVPTGLGDNKTIKFEIKTGNSRWRPGPWSLSSLVLSPDAQWPSQNANTPNPLVSAKKRVAPTLPPLPLPTRPQNPALHQSTPLSNDGLDVCCLLRW